MFKGLQVYLYPHKYYIGLGWHSNIFILFLWTQLKGPGLTASITRRLFFIVLVGGSRFFSRILPYMAPVIFPPTIWILPLPWETAPSYNASTSKLHCWCGVFMVVCRAFSLPNMARSIIAKNVNFTFTWLHRILPGFSKCCVPNSDRASTRLFVSNGGWLCMETVTVECIACWSLSVTAVPTSSRSSGLWILSFSSD